MNIEFFNFFQENIMWSCSSYIGYIVISFLFGILLGLAAGIFLEGYKWRSNADKIQRISSWGHLYKVNHDDENIPNYGLLKKFKSSKELNKYVDHMKNIDEENDELIDKLS